MPQTNKGCEGCKFLARWDSGYSNWTVMNTSVDCLKNVNPLMPINDDIESEKLDKALEFGETCSKRVEGNGPWFDVDGEVTDEDFKDDAEVYSLLKNKKYLND